MKRVKLAGIAFVVLAGVVCPSAAGAAGTPLTMVDPAGVVPDGTVVTAISHNLTTTTSSGILECEEASVPGAVEANDTTKINTVSNEATFSGSFEEGLVGPGACKTSVGIPTLIEASAFPWNAEWSKSGSQGEVLIKGTKKITLVETMAYPPLGENNKCEFEEKSLVSSFALGSAGHPVPVELQTDNAKFKLNKKLPHTSSICAKEFIVNGNWVLNDANGDVSIE